MVALILTLFPVAADASAPPWTPRWVQSFAPTHLWSGPDKAAVDYGPLPQWSFLQWVAPQNGPRLYVYVPWTKDYAYVDATAVGPSGPPPKGWVDQMAQLVRTGGSAADWVGRVTGNELVVRARPTTSAPVSRTLPAGSIVHVNAWVLGTEITPGDWTWAQLSDGGFAYTEAMQIVPPTAPPPPPAGHPSGRWIDVNLLHQTAVAYQGDAPVHLAIVSSGSPGWETPRGAHYIESRVPDETMVGASLNHLGLDAWHSAHATYDLRGVLYTQYFDGYGDALHDNYWLPGTEFGVPHSHGCVGMPVADAAWFWNWATYGVPVVVH
jgi:hypothetical protein